MKYLVQDLSATQTTQNQKRRKVRRKKGNIKRRKNTRMRMLCLLLERRSQQQNGKSPSLPNQGTVFLKAKITFQNLDVFKKNLKQVRSTITYIKYFTG